MVKSFYLTFLVGISTFILANAQTDSLILKNKNIIIGEIKNMDKGVLTIETDYSDSDFKVSWDGIEKVFSKTKYLITLSNGKRYNGVIRSIDDKTVVIDTYDPEYLLNIRKVKKSTTEDIGGGKIEVQLLEIVYLNALV
jgi:small nuclear ribonucleoprotein (snRNP)-like protein